MANTSARGGRKPVARTAAQQRSDERLGCGCRSVVLLGVLWLVGSVFGDDGDDPADVADATSVVEQQTVTVPDLVGTRLDLAKDQLWDLAGDADEYPVAHDLSPRDRHPFADENWTVALTHPAAGQPWDTSHWVCPYSCALSPSAEDLKDRK